MKNFQNKVVLITGGGSATSVAVASRFLEGGAAIVTTDIDAERGMSAVEALKKAGGAVEFVASYLAKAGACDVVVRTVVERRGRLDILVNNAAVRDPVGTLAISNEAWLQSMSVNLNAVFFMCRAAARVMKDRGGAIVNVSSERGLYAVTNAVAYCTTSAAVVQLTRAVAMDLIRYGIRVNAVAPGKIHADGTDSALARRALRSGPIVDRASLSVPMGRLGRPEDVANAVAFLASDEASFIIGTTMSVDGGDTAASPGDTAGEWARTA